MTDGDNNSDDASSTQYCTRVPVVTVSLSHSPRPRWLPTLRLCSPSSPTLLEAKRTGAACARHWAVNVRSRSFRTIVTHTRSKEFFFLGVLWRNAGKGAG